MTEIYHILQIIYNLCIFVLQRYLARLKNVKNVTFFTCLLTDGIL